MAKTKGKVFAGAGNRDAPEKYQNLAYEIAMALYGAGWSVNSGGAEGMDQAFMEGCPRGDVFVPWHGYNGFDLVHRFPKKAFELAIEHHEMGTRLELHRGLHAMHARNAMIVLGKDCKTPVDLLIVYTRDGALLYNDVVPGNNGTGGTGTAIKMAHVFDVPTVNLYHPDSLELIELWTGVDLSHISYPT